MRWSESIAAMKRLPVQANTIGNLMAVTLGIAIAAFVLAAMALLSGGTRHAN